MDTVDLEEYRQELTDVAMGMLATQDAFERDAQMRLTAARISSHAIGAALATVRQSPPQRSADAGSASASLDT